MVRFNELDEDDNDDQVPGQRQQEPQPQPQPNNDAAARRHGPRLNPRRLGLQAAAPPPPPRRTPWCKLLLIGCLGGLCLTCQATLWMMEWMQADRAVAAQRKSREYLQTKQKPFQREKDESTTIPSSSSPEAADKTDDHSFKTELANQPLDQRDLYLTRQRNMDYSTTSSTIAKREALWKQAVSTILADWDPLVEDELYLLTSAGGGGTTLSSSSSSNTNSASTTTTTTRMIGNETATIFGLRALQQAAELGHADAQTTMAHAYMSGIWPTNDQALHVVRGAVVGDHGDASLLPAHLSVQDLLIDDNPQQTQALLWYRMAAMNGNAEAAMAMAHRLEVMHATSAGGTVSTTSAGNKPSSPQQQAQQQCQDRLPYYRAAADAILDDLETNPDSRTKLQPPLEKHVLYQIHLHGGSGSKLDAHNQADESAQAIQYYQVRANTGSAPHAAYTLANLHHYGLRGVEQNASTALHYYNMAAKQGHWEAAGQAAQFYFWGIGTDNNKPDPYAAHRFVQMGMPWDLQGCRRRLERKLKSGSAAAKLLEDGESAEMSLCDANSLNVMGLLLLFGLPMIVGQNADLAQGYFQLAKEQGNRDAAYNLAMVKLGWKTHYQSLDSLDVNGQTSASDFGSVMADSNRWKHGLTQAEMVSIISDLTTAAGAGHIQAKHRLGMAYATGVKVPHRAGFAQIVPKDCDKALKHFRYITDHASPHKSQRLRSAYKQYASGDRASSLRNYLVAAETGSDLAQLNAAFLLEQGECLGMGRVDCAKASVRLWKAAANRGHAEASLRVGDFYYYGRLRPQGLVGPAAWINYVLFPEKHVSKMLSAFWNMARRNFFGPEQRHSQAENNAVGTEREQVGAAIDAEGTCEAVHIDFKEDERTPQKDMEMAVQYYRLAADRSASPRANYNIGFMYQYGLGVKQDFHLAKRHYDLAAAASAQEADLPVTVALMCMAVHEELVKLWMGREGWLPPAVSNFLRGISGTAP